MGNLLQRVGEALYGPRWQTDLSRDLNVADRTMRRWITSGEMPDGVTDDLIKLCQERTAEIGELVMKLRRAKG